MANSARLEQSDLFKRFPGGFLGNRLAKLIIKAGQEAQAKSNYQPNIAIVVRTKNDRPGLEKIIEHLEGERQSYHGRMDLIVVDTESTDGTLEVARQTNAQIVTIKQKDFNYPKGINLGLAQVKNDVVAAFITVGHARPALNICFEAGARHFAAPEVVGVYSDYLPNDNASIWERLFYFLALPIFKRMKAGAHKVSKVRLGAMQGTGCAIRMTAWRKYPFDEAFAHGGEDLEWARQVFTHGHTLIYDPAVTVHHSHGLGFINFAREIKYWTHIARRPGQFNEKRLHRYRPDLRKAKHS